MLPKYPDISEKEYNDRIARAKTVLKKHDLDGLILTEWENVYYFTGFQNAAFAGTKDFPYIFLITKEGQNAFVIRGIMEASARETTWLEDIRGYPRLPSDSKGLVKKAIEDLGLKGKKIGAELGETMAVKFSTGLFLEMMKESGADFVDGAPAMWELRMEKSPIEVARVKEASRIASRACERAFEKLKVGMSEREFSSLVGEYMMAEGADKPTWPVIIQSGQKFKDGLMGTFAGTTKFRKGDNVQVDWGATYRHYSSDLNRMAVLGRQPTAAEKDHWSVYVEANKAGIKAVRPNATASDVFASMAKVFAEAGTPNNNVRAGHGLGLEGHEPPHLGLHDKTVIHPGMVFAIEPFGVRNKEGNFFTFNCEDDVVCTETGSQKLTTIPREIFTA